MAKTSNLKFWTNWLLVITTGLMLYGLSMVATPGLIEKFFGVVMLGDAGAIAAYGAPAQDYIRFAHGVLGSVMFGWGVTLMFVISAQFRRGTRSGWLNLVVSLAVWFVLDTFFSLWAGFWPNAAMNLAFAILFAIPLFASRHEFDGASTFSDTLS